MFVGVVRIELHLPAATSLKDKRAVVRSLKERIRQRVHAAVADARAGPRGAPERGGVRPARAGAAAGVARDARDPLPARPLDRARRAGRGDPAQARPRRADPGRGPVVIVSLPPVPGRRDPAVAEWSGLLAMDKPVGVTSHDVVDLVRRRLRAKGAGHLGTLDPGASGLLMIALGAATRCSTVWQGGEKTYEATIRFGVTTSTQDLQGEVEIERPTDALNEPAVRDASAAFTGGLLQVPPMMSALKVGGQRLYRLARRGETVEREARPIRVAEWTWLSFQLPQARCRIRCSGGTYRRTLAHDLGEGLGTGAALRALRRLRSEPFDLERASRLRDLDQL